MRKTFTRLMASVLLICMLATFIVPATFAEDETVLTYVFDQFDLFTDANGKWAFKEDKDILFSGTTYHGCGKASKECLKECFYDAGLVNWAVDDYSSAANVLFRGSRRSDTALRLNTAGTWVSIRLKVAEAGKYDIALRSFQTRKADAYIFPASELTDGKTAVDFMTAEHKLDDIAFAAVEGGVAATLGEDVALTAGEHIIVFQISSEDSRFYINEITLTKTGEYSESDETTTSTATTETSGETNQATTAPEQTTAPTLPEGNYWNFKVEETAGCEGVVDGGNRNYDDNCLCGQSHTVKEHLDGFYAQLGWKVSAASTENMSNISVRKDKGGIRFTPEGNGWVAITLKVTESGLHDVYVTGTSTQDSINAYMFAGALTPEQVAEKIADKNAIAADLMATNITPSTSGPVTIGTKDFTAGEYTFVLHCARTDKGRSIYLTGIGLKEYTGDPEGPTTPSTPSTPGDTDCAGTYTDNFFNFALATEEDRHPMFNNGSGLADRDYTSKCYACGKTVKDCLAKHWADGNLNWVLEGTSFAEMRIQVTGGVRFRYDADADGKKIPAGQKDGKDVYQETVGNWIAYRVKVANPGTFTVTVAKTFAYGWVGEMYIMPAPAATMSKGELTDAMTEQNRVGAVEFTATMTTSKVGDYNFAAAGEYIIMIKATGSKRMYLDSISLTVPQEEQPIPAVDTKIYDFDLMKDDPTLIKKGPSSRYDAEGTIRTDAHIESLYESNTIDWKFETQSAKWQASTASFRTGCFRFKSATNYRDVADRQWFAFRIENPGTDTYDIRLTTSQAGMMVANIYLIPASSPMTLSAAKIEAAMTQENMLVKGAIFDKKDTFYLGDYTFGMDEEYVLVFELTKGTQLFLNEIKMTRDGLVADGTVKKEKTISGFVYDFDLGDSLNGYFSKSRTNMPDVISELNAMWYNGTLKWKWESSTSGKEPASIHRFYRVGGMRLFHKEDAWAAVRIKSPGTGTYTLTMNHAITTSGGTCAVYILPGDTEDIEFAMDPKNRVGKVAMYNDGINPNLEDGKTSFVGYFDFEAGKEYIMVFESYTNSPYAANSYVNISQVIAQKGKLDYETQEDKTVAPVVVQENVVPVADALSTGVVADVYGHDYFFLPVEGGYTLVYDLDTGELVDEIHTGYARTLDMRQDQDGNIWISGSSKYIVRYDPYTKEASRTPAFGSVSWMGNYSGAYSICPTPDGKLWFGTYYSAVLGVYDPETQEYRKVGPVHKENISQIHGIIYHDGYLYMSVHNDTTLAIVKFDMATEQVVGTVDVTHMAGTVKYLNNLSMLGDGDYLVAGINSNKLEGFICVDPKTMELYEDHGLFGGMGMNATEVIDGKQYLVCTGYGLYEYDLATRTFSKTPGFGNDGIGFRSSGNSLVTLNGERCLLTWTTSGGHPRYFNLDTKEYKTWDNLVVHGSGGAAIREVATGLEGDTNLYIGVFNSDQGAIFDTALGKKTGQFRSGGQGDSFIWYEGKFYAGNYSSTTLNEITLPEDPTVIPAVNEYIQRWQLNHEETGQKRVHTLAAGDGYVFAGTIPDTGSYGGSVTVYDTKTGRWYTHRNVVEHCAVTGLEYSEKLLYGATSTAGGSGTTAEKPEGSSAKCFVYDYENREVVATLDPRDYIQGLAAGAVTLISSFGKDPVVEGRMWAVVSETLFCFTYDTEAKTFQVQEVISFDKTAYDTSAGGSLWCKKILFDAERNYVYVSFATNGGFQRIEIEDLSAQTVKVIGNTRLMGDKPQFFAIGADGNIYYGNSAALKMLPLNITDEDWAIAAAVDKLVSDLGEITLESEAAIKSARSAYDNLSWRYKALTQKLELLQESETDLLECKIDVIVLEDVDADSLPELQGYVDTYNGFNARQKKYTKNYDHLMEAYTKASKLNDERVAAAMQKRMDALGEKLPLTLDDEPEVLQLRADFDALTGPQRVLVDAANLEEAEAQIKVLRAEFVIYVEELIQKIPAEITLEAEEVIMTAREAADKLYTNERKNVSYSKLTSAEGKLRTLQKAKAAADEVDALIDAIGIVTLGDKERIAEAREAYDTLNDTALTFLQKGKKLVRAEFILKALQTWGIPVITVVNAGIVFAVLWFVPSLHTKVFKTKKKEEEVIDN